MRYRDAAARPLFPERRPWCWACEAEHVHLSLACPWWIVEFEVARLAQRLEARDA